MKSAAQSSFFSTNKTLNICGRLVDLSIPRIMGILNVTPDSFYDGGRYQSEDDILKQTEKMLTEGATFIDVGAYSSRPGAKDVSLDDEKKSALRAVKAISKWFPDAIISVDTFRSEVARACISEGATLVNDVSGGELDPLMFSAIAELKVPYIIMHMRGTPQTMASLTQYDHLMKEIVDHFHAKIASLHAMDVSDIIVDPGFGFSKTVPQNFELLRHFDYLKILGKPLLAGLSRKSMVWRTLEISPEEALPGTTALHAAALLKGATILRVHDVKEAIQTVKLISYLM
ncbi:MAG TPA: dihydropteroate synthase [Ohtaekwangia sp.]|nr:dihydropteroate synthase [Ohtaekwangia sp.]